ncbi:MAG: AAA family ATPase [Chloroflexota bacterium]|nr:AAA family ATPase [Chloroflexota bacterium]
MDRPSVLLALADDPAAYIEALTRAGFDPITDTEAASRRLSEGGDLQLAVLDCDLPASTVATAYGALHGHRQVATLLLLGPESEALPPGVGGPSDEYVLKPIPPEALVFRLQALLIRAGSSLPAESSSWVDADALSSAPIAGEGHVVSVFAPKGGVGKTTIAVNVAVALREQTRSQVLLLDADVGVGNVTAVLEVPFRYGLADLADSPPEEWTDAAFELLISTHTESGVRVLTWGSDPGQSERVGVDLLLAALRWAKRHHSHVIVDNHPGYDDRTMAMLTLSDEIFLVITPEVGALRNSAQFLDLAREVGLGSMVRVIVNRANHGIKLADMARSLGLPISATIVSAGPKAVMAANEGKPVITKFPKEKISDDLHRVARLISRPEASAAPAAAERPWWLRFGTRTSGA